MKASDHNEHIGHKIQSTPFRFCHVTPDSPCYCMPLHHHSSFEIVRVLSGNLSIQINDQCVNAVSSDIILINQENEHSYSPDDCVYQLINFDTDELMRHTSLRKGIQHIFTNNNATILPLSSVDHAELYHIAVKLFELASTESDDNDLLILSALYELLGTIYRQRHFTENRAYSVAENKFKFLIEYIENNYAQRISVEDMARVSCMSNSYFTTIFKDFFGKTPVQYLNAYRVERASTMLSDRSLSITEVAYRCGFTDSSYFVKVFKKYKNIAPRDYRRALTDSDTD